MRRFAHIICPVLKPEGHELHTAQPISFASLLRAREEAKGTCDVRFFTAQFPEDRNIAPEAFEPTADLDRSIADLLKLQNPRRLPVLSDVLNRALEASDAEWIIYSNIDIAVMPFFYKVIHQYLDAGHDALIINRRRISKRFTKPEQLDLMYAEAGKLHTGYDMFVIHRSLFPKFILTKVCIGLPFADTLLIHNIYAHAANYRLCTEKHLTFHIGEELVKKWGDADASAFNKKEFLAGLKQLYPHFSIDKFPGAGLSFFRRHFRWLLNPTFHYPTMLKLDFSQLGKKRPKPQPPENRQGWFEYLVRKVNFRERELGGK